MFGWLRVGASPGDGTFEPSGRGWQLLADREAVLSSQSERARRAARTRALALYRLLRFAVTERGAGAPESGEEGEPRLGGRAVSLTTAVLERELDEARSLRAELDRVRALRASLGSPAGAGRDRGVLPAVPLAPSPTRHPSFLQPIDGAVAIPFGVGRDAATGAAIFRAGASFVGAPGQAVRCPADGRVVRVADSVAGGVAVVLAHDRNRWTTVVSGLGSVGVSPGEFVRRGAAIGNSVRGSAATVRIETWRGRTPIDPTSVLQAR